jgi:hypothetical protein
MATGGFDFDVVYCLLTSKLCCDYEDLEELVEFLTGWDCEDEDEEFFLNGLPLAVKMLHKQYPALIGIPVDDVNRIACVFNYIPNSNLVHVSGMPESK